MKQDHGRETEVTVEGLRRELTRVRMQLEETRSLAAARERVLKANVSSLEKMYSRLSEKMGEIRSKGYEIKVLNTLNNVIATASRYVGLEEILSPTLEVVMRSVEELEYDNDHNVHVIGGGVFVLDEKLERLTLRAVSGLRREQLGCGGVIAPGECICGLAMKTAGLVTTPDCLSDERHTVAHPEGAAVQHAHVTIPLMSGERVTGVMFLYMTPQGYDPGMASREIFTAIGRYLGLHIDRAMLYDTVQHMAMHDGLTGLFNHRELKHRLALEVKRARRQRSALSLLLIDIDYFKRVNDEFGHPAGDRVLIKLASVIKQTMREIDTAARYGGEEFAVILPDTSEEGAMKAAERIREAVEKMTTGASDRPVRITVSIGVCSLDGGSAQEMDILKAADTALYAAKDGGRNCVRAGAPRTGAA